MPADGRDDPLRALVGYLTGPTAVGKTNAALALAERRGWAILSVDSRQIYRRLEIGTAKPTLHDRERVEHLMVDILDPAQHCSAGAFRRTAMQALAGRPPRSVLAVGGAGLYWEALTRDLHALPQADPVVRARHRQILESEGAGGLYRRLKEIDPDAARWLSPNDRQRISRALEVAEITGRPMSRILAEPRPAAEAALPVAVLLRPRAELYGRIVERCGLMLSAGLVGEVEAILVQGVKPDAPGLRSVGYREFIPHILADAPLERCVGEFVRNTKRYAKRQETWLRNRTPGARFLETSGTEDPECLGRRIEAVLSHDVAGTPPEVSP